MLFFMPFSVTLMSLAADYLVANIVYDSSIHRTMRLVRPEESAKEDGEMGEDEGQMLANEDLSKR